jgi:hypothetical protein
VLPNHSLEPWKNTRISDGSRPARRDTLKESWPGRSPLRSAPGCFAKLEAVRQQREVSVHGVSTTTAVTVQIPRERFFYWFLSVDPSRIMRAYAILPGVATTRGQTGPMHHVGATRQIVFLDGTSAIEEITQSDPPSSLNYRVHNLTSAFRILVRDGEARLAFNQPSPGETAVEWRYTFHGHGRLAELILRPLVAWLWRGFLHATLLRAKHLAEAEETSSPSSVAA